VDDLTISWIPPPGVAIATLHGTLPNTTFVRGVLKDCQTFYYHKSPGNQRQSCNRNITNVPSAAIEKILRSKAVDKYLGQSGRIMPRDTFPGSGIDKTARHHRTPSYSERYSTPARGSSVIFLCLLAVSLFTTNASAALISFSNCLPASTISSNPRRLQWVPLYVDARFDKKSSDYLNLTLYGNVTGQTVQGIYPPATSPDWTNPDVTFGKIVNSSQNFTTLFTKYNVLTYTPYNAQPSEFCSSFIGGTHCPIAPAFFANKYDYTTLPAFEVNHHFSSSYAFSSIDAIVSVLSGDPGAPQLACITANVTPAVPSSISGALTFIPLVVLIFVALATVLAATFSPWGTTDPFRWSSNYGRDEDMIRLVTPGFGDCLQYIQFIILAGSLSLAYPGFYQPVVSHVGWSALMFNESYVSHGTGYVNPQDGVYVTNSTRGLTRMSQLIGQSHSSDIWGGMVVWLLVVIGAMLLLCQLAFFARWAMRALTNNPKEDLRSKNWPFCGGNIVRVTCNFFLLPIVSLSMYQLVLGAQSPSYVVALAVVLLVFLLLFAGWILRLIFTTTPRSQLFDDLPTVLLYGPLYNTYSDDAAPFALIPALLTVIRGIAIGAIQPTGIAQLVILAICEVVFILTLHAFKPFHSPTSMNAYHTFFSSVRLTTLLLSVAFVPSLGVSEGPKGWIGYLILLLHGIVLVFGFFINALQRIIEVSARLAGAGGDDSTGAATRGGLGTVFGVRQLSRRQKRPEFRRSLTSDAAVLTEDADAKSVVYGDSRARSASGGSAILLNKQQRPYSRVSVPFDPNSPDTDVETPYERSTFNFLPNEERSAAGASKRPELGLNTQAVDPYYRAPRQRRQTGELTTPGAKSRSSWMSADWTGREFDDNSPETSKRDSVAWPLSSAASPPLGSSPPYQRGEPATDDPRRPNVDYAVREVDFYYGVRGPALSSQPTRKLKTGPADPVGPASAASGWFRGMFGRKSKDVGKGFEVVRSARAPPQNDEEGNPQSYPYQDSPDTPNEPYLPGQQTRSLQHDSANEDTFGKEALSSDDDIPSPIEDEGLPGRLHRYPSAVSAISDRGIHDGAPTLGPVDFGGNVDFPSRYNSRQSRAGSGSAVPRSPAIPRRSSRRQSSADVGQVVIPRLPTVVDSIEPASNHDNASYPRLPFTTPSAGHHRNRLSMGAESFDDEIPSSSYHRATPSNATSLMPPSISERPTSVGHVNHYRASDSIQPGMFSEGTYPGGSAAELVDNDVSANRGNP